MNTEEHAAPSTNPESPFADPQSPGLPHLHQHQPTTDGRDDPMHTAGIRRRHHVEPNVQAAASGSGPVKTMRIQIQTPLSDLGDSRRKEVVIDRGISVSELKDGLVSGLYGNEGWTREGMRLVWRGRIVRDEEKLGDITATVSYTYLAALVHRIAAHLYRRRIACRHFISWLDALGAPHVAQVEGHEPIHSRFPFNKRS